MSAAEDVARDSKAGRELPTRIQYTFVKSNLFRVVHSDGVYGGTTPTGQINLFFFNERFPLPQQISHSFTQAAGIGEELRDARITKTGIIREVEANMVMSLDSAKTLHQWLGDKIVELEAILGVKKDA